jgi:RNA-binding protein
MSSLSGKAARHLRALGHDLSPVVSIGKDGITDGVVDATRAALLTHELVKVRVQGESPLDRKDAASELASKTSSTLAQVLGRTFLLYKRHPKKPKIELPRE